MNYTFKPEQNHAKAKNSLYVSKKDAMLVCKLIRKKKLSTVKRLLADVAAGKRSIGGRYYTKTVKEMEKLVKSAEKNAEAQLLDINKLFVYASCHDAPRMRRSRRKSDFGNEMKVTHVEIILVEKGSEKKQPVKKPVVKKPEKAPEKK